MDETSKNGIGDRVDEDDLDSLKFPCNDLEWASLLESSLGLHEFENSLSEDILWPSLPGPQQQKMSPDLNEPMQISQHSLDMEEASENAYDLEQIDPRSESDWIKKFFDADTELIEANLGDSNSQTQRMNEAPPPNTDWFSSMVPGTNPTFADFQGEGPEVAYSSSYAPRIDSAQSVEWTNRLNSENPMPSDVAATTSQMTNEEYTTRLGNLVVRMQQSELSRIRADRLLKASPRRSSLDGELQQTRSKLRQMIHDDCEYSLKSIVNERNVTDPKLQSQQHLLKLKVQCLQRLVQASNSLDSVPIAQNDGAHFAPIDDNMKLRRKGHKEGSPKRQRKRFSALF